MRSIFGLIIALSTFTRVADSGLLPALSPQYDAGKWYAQLIVNEHSADVRVIESTVVERQNAV
jgi:Ni,Fe-hydrogenase III small subunit